MKLLKNIHIPKRRRLMLGAFFLLVVVSTFSLVSSVSQHKAYAASPCPPSSWIGGDCGYFYDDYFNTSTTEGDYVFPSGLNGTNENTCSGTEVGDLNSFVSFMTNNLNSSNNQEQIGAAFTIIALYEDGGTGNNNTIHDPINYAKSLISNNQWNASTLNSTYSYNPCQTTASYATDFKNFSSSAQCDNTLYAPPQDVPDGNGNGDIVSFNEACSDYNNLWVVTFTNRSNGAVFFIKYICGNPVGFDQPQNNLIISGISSGPGSPTWSLTGTTKVSTTSGKSATFNSRVYNNSGTYTASYSWWVQGCYGSSSTDCGAGSSNWTRYSCNSGTNNGANPCDNTTGLSGSGGTITCPSQNYCPAYDTIKAQESFKFPSSASPGDTYCERIAFDPSSTSNGAGIGYSPDKCVTLPKPGNTRTGCSVSCGTSPYATPDCVSSTNMNIGASNYVDPNNSAGTADTSLKYAVYYVPPGGTAPTSTWTAGDSYTNADQTSNTTGYPDPGSDANVVETTDSPLANGSAIPDVTLSSTQVYPGSSTWYIVTYNNSSSYTGLVVEGSQSVATYSDTTYIDYVQSFAGPTNCFQATCGPIDVSGTFPNAGNDTSANAPFTYNVTINDTGPNDLDDGGDSSFGNLTLKSTYAGNTGGPTVSQDFGSDILAGNSGTSSEISAWAPNDASSNPVTISVGYPGTHLSDLVDCSYSINDFVNFSYSTTWQPTLLKTITPRKPDSEDPSYVEKYYSYTYQDNTIPGYTEIPGNLSVTGQLTYVPYGTPTNGGSVKENDTLTGSPTTKDYTIAETFHAGDGYCLEMDVTPSEGWAGPSGEVLDDNGNPAGSSGYSPQTTNGETNCVYIQDEPYAAFTGNDVIGDPAFDPVCQNSTGSGSGYNSGIYTMSTDNAAGGGYVYPSQTSSPASTGGTTEQFGAQALGIIEGLSSAGYREAGSNPSGPLGLTFANNGNSDEGGNVSSSPGVSRPGTITGDGNPMGGYFGYSTSMCEPDYFSEEPANQYLTANISEPADNDPNTTATINNDLRSDTSFTPTASNPYGYNYEVNKSLTIGDGSDIDIGNGVRATIFVTGNVYIDSNIEYSGATAGSGQWNNLSDIPSLYIVAKGNIYIDPSVKQLDGVYIAETNTNNGTGTPTGIIDTCATASGVYAPAYLFGDGTYSYVDNSGNTVSGSLPGCNKQLTVNGAFVDEATLLDRSFSSLRYSEAGENSLTGTTFQAHSCGNLTSGSIPGDINSSYGTTNFTNCAAEVFNFSPELYLSQPSFVPEAGPTMGTYHYITGLSPVL